MDKTTDNYVIPIAEIMVDAALDYVLDTAVCPYCNGLFGVDITYLEQEDYVVHCPICCMEVVFGEWI